MSDFYVEDFHNKKDFKKMRYCSLGNTDMTVSTFGFGGSAIGGHHSTVDEDEAIAVVHTALKRGINYIDTAPWYGFGTAEKVLGKALATVPRRAYYVATKVGRYEPDYTKMFDFSSARTLRSVAESLEKINCGYLDLIQVHDVEFAPNLDVILNETLPTLQKLKDAGKTRYIGITGYPLETLKTIVERSRVDIDTILSYCRCCMHDTTLMDNITYFQSKGIGVIDAAGVGMGLYTTNELPDWHPAGPEIRQACKQAAAYCQENNVNFTKLAIYFNLHKFGPDTHLISCAQLDILGQNLDVCFNGLSATELQVLEYIQFKYFKPLKTRHWEGIELEKYWRKISEANKEK